MDLTKYNKKSITNAWSKVCLIADGMAINTTVYALKISGILDFIHQAKVPVKVDNMINLFNIKNRGILIKNKILNQIFLFTRHR